MLFGRGVVCIGLAIGSLPAVAQGWTDAELRAIEALRLRREQVELTRRMVDQNQRSGDDQIFEQALRAQRQAQELERQKDAADAARLQRLFDQQDRELRELRRKFGWDD